MCPQEIHLELQPVTVQSWGVIPGTDTSRKFILAQVHTWENTRTDKFTAKEIHPSLIAKEIHPGLVTKEIHPGLIAKEIHPGLPPPPHNVRSVTGGLLSGQSDLALSDVFLGWQSTGCSGGFRTQEARSHWSPRTCC